MMFSVDRLATSAEPWQANVLAAINHDHKQLGCGAIVNWFDTP
jgi:hypothetical protein